MVCLVALTDASTITVAVVAAFVLLALVAMLRVLLRREPSPPSWARYRVGVFVERERDLTQHEQPDDQSGKPKPP